jgi:hypothetical protein
LNLQGDLKILPTFSPSLFTQGLGSLLKKEFPLFTFSLPSSNLILGESFEQPDFKFIGQ